MKSLDLSFKLGFSLFSCGNRIDSNDDVFVSTGKVGVRIGN